MWCGSLGLLKGKSIAIFGFSLNRPQCGVLSPGAHASWPLCRACMSQVVPLRAPGLAASGRVANYIPDSQGILQTTPLIGDSTFTKNKATRLFNPRVALAWDPWDNGNRAVELVKKTPDAADLEEKLKAMMAGTPRKLTWRVL